MATRDSRRGARKPHGEKAARYTRSALQACSSRWICLPTHTPPFFSCLSITTYEVTFSYQIPGQFLPTREKFICLSYQIRLTLAFKNSLGFEIRCWRREL